ncbi:MAG: hypothetical protein QF632_00430 [Candidatus Woesearchaeota archaeon]|jgi:hypothetical protein|nr:hypothetical protein [Candidatus Woesearchaeota archaeon]MDP7323207.1 hypothetical protein [Candidatus Woesearchaeota archaeon]MDP7458424.1 hypothetical protein [Candidatus Woesearchaeota archaeon]
MRKQAQMTIFMIIGIIMVFMLIFVIMFANIIRDDQIGQSYRRVVLSGEEIRQTKDYTDSCIKNRADALTNLLGFQGGILFGDEYEDPSITKGDFIIPYFLHQGKAFIPNSVYLQERLSQKIQQEFYDCLDPDVLSSVGVELIKPLVEDVGSDVLITSDNILFTINTTLMVKKGSFQTVLEDFYYNSPIKLLYILEKSQTLVTLIRNANSDPENPGAFDISQKDAPQIDFSSELIMACYVKEGRDKFIRFEQYNEQGDKIYNFLFVIDGLVSGECTKIPFE